VTEGDIAVAKVPIAVVEGDIAGNNSLAAFLKVLIAVTESGIAVAEVPLAAMEGDVAFAKSEGGVGESEGAF